LVYLNHCQLDKKYTIWRKKCNVLIDFLEEYISNMVFFNKQYKGRFILEIMQVLIMVMVNSVLVKKDFKKATELFHKAIELSSENLLIQRIYL